MKGCRTTCSLEAFVVPSMPVLRSIYAEGDGVFTFDELCNDALLIPAFPIYPLVGLCLGSYKPRGVVKRECADLLLVLRRGAHSTAES